MLINILQSGSDLSLHSDGTPALTPSSVVGHQILESDRPVMAESAQHSVDAAASDASQSSHEQTDASSVDSLDIASAEKPKSKNGGRRSLKDTVMAKYRKRKSVTTPCTNYDPAVSGKDPEAPVSYTHLTLPTIYSV